MSFFICQPHLPQNHIEGLQRTLQPRRPPQLLERQIVLFGQQGAKLAPVSGDNHRFAPGMVMSWGNIASVPALLEELLDHPKGDAEAAGNFLAGPFILVVRSQNPFPQIQ
jgi:hypothetical protein